MLKKVGRFVLLLVATSVLITACSTSIKPNETGDKAANTANPSPSASMGPAQITIWGTSEEDFIKLWGDRYKTVFPNYTLKFVKPATGTQLPDLIGAGQTVDIVIGSIGAIGPAAGHLIDVNLQMDMSDLVKKHNIDLSRFDKTFIDGMQNFGGLYGLPVFSSNMILYYNKDIFDKLSVPYPKDGITWDDAVEMAKKLTSTVDGRQYYGFTTSVGHYLNINQFTLPYADGKTGTALLGNEKYKKMLEMMPLSLMQKVEYKTYIQSSGNKFPDPNKAFSADQNVAMHLWFSEFVTHPDFMKVNFDIAAIPTFKELPAVGSQAYPVYYAVTSTSKVKDDAVELIKYLTSNEIQLSLSKKGGVLPVLVNDEVKKAYGQEAQASGSKKNFQAVFYYKNAAPMIRTKYDNIVQGEIVKALPLVVTGQTDLNTALRTAEEAANKAIKEKQK